MARAVRLDAGASRAPGPPQAPGTLLDLRFRALLPERDRAALPPAVQRRFSKRLAAGASAVYAGRVVAARMGRPGMPRPATAPDEPRGQ